MTSLDRFDRDLATWLDAEGSHAAPEGLHAAAVDRARRVRQRPGWLVGVTAGVLG